MPKESALIENYMYDLFLKIELYFKFDVTRATRVQLPNSISSYFPIGIVTHFYSALREACSLYCPIAVAINNHPNSTLHTFKRSERLANLAFPKTSLTLTGQTAQSRNLALIWVTFPVKSTRLVIG